MSNNFKNIMESCMSDQITENFKRALTAGTWPTVNIENKLKNRMQCRSKNNILHMIKTNAKCQQKENKCKKFCHWQERYENFKNESANVMYNNNTLHLLMYYYYDNFTHNIRYNKDHYDCFEKMIMEKCNEIIIYLSKLGEHMINSFIDDICYVFIERKKNYELIHMIINKSKKYIDSLNRHTLIRLLKTKRFAPIFVHRMFRKQYFEIGKYFYDVGDVKKADVYFNKYYNEEILHYGDKSKDFIEHIVSNNEWKTIFPITSKSIEEEINKKNMIEECPICLNETIIIELPCNNKHGCCNTCKSKINKCFLCRSDI